MSIRRRMTITLVATLVVMLGTAGAVLYVYLQKELTRQFDDVLRVKAANLASLLRQENDGKIDFDFSDNAMPEFSVSKAPDYFQLWSDDGKSIERSASLGKQDLELNPSAQILPQLVDIKLPDGRSGRVLLVAATPSSENNNEGNSRGRPRPKPQNYVLAVTRDRATLDRTLATIGIADVAGIALLALAFGGLVPLLIARNLRPLDDIAAKANQIDAHSLGNRFPVETMPTELRPICARLNDSLARLQAAFERERRFSGDVAHELRTPIAELRLLADLGVKHNEPGTPTQRSFQDALDVSIQMEHIVEALLEMMAPDAPIKPDELENVNLSQMIDQAWRPLESEASRKGLALDHKANGVASVRSNPTMLGRIIANLLSNAVEYSAAKGTVTWHEEARSGRMVITITNPTSELAADDLAHLAEPFWRKDAARTSGRHAGLGLALVTRYAERLGIQVKWSLPSANMFCVQLEIPS